VSDGRRYCGVCRSVIEDGEVFFEWVNGLSKCLTCGSASAAKAAAAGSRAAILEAARDAVLRDRAATHGSVEASFGQLASVWSVRLGVTVTPAQVALMLVDLKVTRAWGNPGHGDNWVDIAGYAACGGEIAGDSA
jgi:hypothetical protein